MSMDSVVLAGVRMDGAVHPVRDVSTEYACLFDLSDVQYSRDAPIIGR